MATKESEAEADPLRDPDTEELEAHTLEGERHTEESREREMSERG
jgi:hypothetical protein